MVIKRQKKAIEWDYEAKIISELLEKLDIYYDNIWLYILAFVHRSIVNERPDYTPEHNERLEFLWDAVLELVVTEKLFSDFKKKPEWELTDIRSMLVRWKNLAKVAKKLDFMKYLFLWKWEEKSWGRDNEYILANSVEAFLWAIYLDLWFEEAKKFVLEHIYSTLGEIMSKYSTKDYKTLFQEFSQEKFDITPTYEVLFEKWPDHDKIFEVAVMIWKKQAWIWFGTSKKKAQEKSAENAYNTLINIS